MSKSHVLLRYTRLIHLYFGVFISPALIFFAFTGALQTFSLHETTRGSNYKPPAWAVTLGQIHKKQTPVMNKRPPAPGAEAKPRQEGHGDGDHGSHDRGDRGGNDHAPATNVTPAPASSGPAAVLAKPHNALPLKIFFLLVSIGLFTSTVTGIYMSYKYIRNRLLISALLFAGTVIPVLMVIL